MATPPDATTTLAALRTEYALRGLTEGDLASDPFAQFRAWFAEALAAHVPEPNAMTLATAARDGRPAARIVLLKELDAQGFVFYTNYTSRKGRELDENPHAALAFHWIALERQVRVEGRVERVDGATSDAYFRSRPRGSQLGAWASPQSDTVPSRNALEAALAQCEARFADGEVPRPPHWGGFRVLPEAVEFWQGRPNRLHDRLRFARAVACDGWTITRLGP